MLHTYDPPSEEETLTKQDKTINGETNKTLSVFLFSLAFWTFQKDYNVLAPYILCSAKIHRKSPEKLKI